MSLFTDAGYAIEVHGPNGFYRSFTGTPVSPDIQVRTEYEQKHTQFTGNIKVHLKNTNGEPLTVRIQDNSYKAGARTKTIHSGREESMVLHLRKSHNWYDFTVMLGSEAEARFAGRVETGRPSYSDPFMGGIV